MSTLLGFLDAKIKDEFVDEAWKANKIGGRLCISSSIKEQELNDLKRFTICEQCDERMVFIGQIFCPLEIDSYDRYLIMFACNKANCKRWSIIRYIQNAAESNGQMDHSQPKQTFKEDWLNDQDDWNDDSAKVDDQASANEINTSSGQNNKADDQFVVVHEDTTEFIQPYYLEVEQEGQTEEHAKLDSHVEELLKSYKEKNEKSPSKDAEYTKIDETDILENYNNDVQTYKFYKRLSLASGQVIRYGWAQKPLPNATNVNLDTANCDQCGSPRVFEFQLMPALINYLKFKSNNLPLNLDFASVLVFTCKQNCSNKMLTRESYLLLEEADQHIPEDLLKS